jgi:hypothetical protein
LFYQTSPKGILEEFSARLKQILWIFFVASLNQFLPDSFCRQKNAEICLLNVFTQ